MHIVYVCVFAHFFAHGLALLSAETACSPPLGGSTVGNNTQFFLSGSEHKERLRRDSKDNGHQKPKDTSLGNDITVV